MVYLDFDYFGSLFFYVDFFVVDFVVYLVVFLVVDLVDTLVDDLTETLVEELLDVCVEPFYDECLIDCLLALLDIFFGDLVWLLPVIISDYLLSYNYVSCILLVLLYYIFY